jgi:hypothetical protein
MAAQQQQGLVGMAALQQQLAAAHGALGELQQQLRDTVQLLEQQR